MSIADILEKCKSILSRGARDVLILAIIVLAALFSFGLGYAAGRDAADRHAVPRTTSPAIDTSGDQRVVASRSGTKYYLGWCAGRERITEANAVWFDSPEEARAAGYTPAANCSGL